MARSVRSSIHALPGQPAIAGAGIAPQRSKVRPIPKPKRRASLLPDTVPADPARVESLLSRTIEFVPHPHFALHRESPEIEALERPLAPPPAVDSQVRVPAGLPPYLASLYEVPLLGKAREAELFVRMNYLRFKAARLRDRLRTNPLLWIVTEVESLLAQALEVRNDILRANLRLVVSIAKKFADQNVSFDELVSEGNMPLIRAIELFDISRGYRFSTYGTWAVRNHLQRYVSDRQKARTRFISGDDYIADCVADDRSFSAESEVRVHRQRGVFAQVFQKLTEREQYIVGARFGLDRADEPQTLAEIGRALGISKERVRQLALLAVDKLRRLAAESETEAVAAAPSGS